MDSKMLVIFAVLCLLGSCWGDEDTTRGSARHEDVPMDPIGARTDPDLVQDSSFWRFWNFWKWDFIMFYLDLQRTVTRRDSSLLLQRRYSQVEEDEDEKLSTGRASNVHLASESAGSAAPRPRGSVRKEVVTSLFEAMLDSIVLSWEVIAQLKPEDSHRNSTEVTFAKKKKASTAKPIKGKKSRSKIDLDVSQQNDPIFQNLWSSPDEKAVVRFKNGNVYEGNISMKRMHGEGRMQWADGTVYLGHFNDNEMRGRGHIQWKDDTWYEGDFVGNLRHGKGVYVDSRKHRSYAGEWHCGTKHGQGLLFYSAQSSYDGEWINNVRHGFGSREYCALSGYRGEWDRYVRSGAGMMIWPNHDFYKGDWRNGVMHGYGIYVWDAYYNNSMSLPSLNAYRGCWEKGLRNGYGLLNLGLGLGSHYKGHFKENKKDGPGQFVTNNGLILKEKHLFYGDILGPVDPNQQLVDDDISIVDSECKLLPAVLEPFQFNICDNTVGLGYHIDVAIQNLDKQEEIRANMINEFIENNKDYDCSIIFMSKLKHKEEYHSVESENLYLEDLKEFEELSLRKSLKCFENYLKEIYYKYATICNTEVVSFTPVLIRLYMWQFYYDLEIQHKGLTLVEIDQTFHENKEWLSKLPHNPFEKIYFWQFVHSLVSVANILYARKHLPGPKPDTIMASAFRTFMQRDVLPGQGRRYGRLTNGYGGFVPLKPLYELYRYLGEPHTVRQFLCAVHPPLSRWELSPPELAEAPEDCLPLGRNVYILGDEVTFITDEKIYFRKNKNCLDEKPRDELSQNLLLFNLSNLSTKAIIDTFSQLLPQVSEGSIIMNLNVEITFYEFFEAILACAEESNRVKDEEIRWRARLSLSSTPSRTVHKKTSKLQHKSPKVKL